MIVCVALVACDIGTLHPPASRAPISLAITPSFQLGPGAASAYSHVDNVLVRFKADDEVRLLEIRPFDPLLSEVRLLFSVPLEDASELFTVELELRMNDATIFEGSGNATLTAERSTDVEVDLEPVIESLSCTGPLIAFASYGDSQQLTATALVASGDEVDGVTVGWSSTNSNVASVNSAGLVTAVGDGITSIVCNADGAFDARAVQVSAVVTSVQVTPVQDTISVGGTRQFVATSRDARNNVIPRTVTWLSTNITVAAISGTGLATGVAPGSAGIRATSTSNPNVFGTAALTVRPQLPTVLIDAITEFRDSTATVVIRVNPSGSATQAFVDWGTSPTLATFARTTQAVGSGNVELIIALQITGLQLGTTYYDRAGASNGAGTAQSPIVAYFPTPGMMEPYFR